MFHGGDGAEASANNCKPLEQNLRPNQHVLAVLLLACCVGRWFHLGGEVATTLLSYTRGRSDTSYGATFGGYGHCSERPQWVDELIGDVRHPPIDHARGPVRGFDCLARILRSSA